MTALLAAEALFAIERHDGVEGVSWIVRDARGTPVDRCGTETSARTSVRWRAEPIAAALEAAERAATERAAAACEARAQEEQSAATSAAARGSAEQEAIHFARASIAKSLAVDIRDAYAVSERPLREATS